MYVCIYIYIYIYDDREDLRTLMLDMINRMRDLLGWLRLEYGTIQPYNIEQDEPNSELGVHRDINGKKEMIL